MKTFAYTLELKDDPAAIEKYKSYHKAVWPEVLQSIRKSGVQRSKIFLLGTRLFLLVEADDDYEADQLQDYTAGAREIEWDELMRTYQVPVSEAKPGEWWAEMELVYDLESQLAKLKNTEGGQSEGREKLEKNNQ